MPKSPRLFGLYYSPWTERARWAMDLYGVEYRYREHSPLIGEWLLRFHARKTGLSRATVPLLIDGPVAVGDSFDIMMHAERISGGDALGTVEPAVVAWREPVEHAMEETRARVARRVLRDPDALKEAAMAAVPEFLAGVCRPIAALGVRFFSRKYGFELEHAVNGAPRLDAVLSRAREAVGRSGQYLEGQFSAADMMVATLLQAVEPVSDEYLLLGPATRKAWRHEELAEEYRDLLEWRDMVYQRHRKESFKSSRSLA